MSRGVARLLTSLGSVVVATFLLIGSPTLGEPDTRPAPSVSLLPVPNAQAVGTAGGARMVIGIRGNYGHYGQGQLVATVSRGGRPFASATLVDGRSYRNTRVAIAGTRHRFYVVWTHETDTTSAVFVRAYIVGKGWGPRHRVARGHGSYVAGYPMTRPNGRVAVVWTSYQDAITPIGHVTVRVPGGHWVHMRVGRLGRFGFFRAGIGNNGRVTVLTDQPQYRGDIQTGDRLQVRTRRPSEHSWSVLETFANGKTYCGDARLAVNGRGAIAVAWLPTDEVESYDAATIRTWVRAAGPRHRVITRSFSYHSKNHLASRLRALTLGSDLKATLLWPESVSLHRARLRSTTLDNGRWSNPATVVASTVRLHEEAFGTTVLTEVASNKRGNVWVAATFHAETEDGSYFRTSLHHLSPRGKVLRSTTQFASGGSSVPPVIGVAVSPGGRGTMVWSRNTARSYVASYHH